MDVQFISHFIQNFFEIKRHWKINNRYSTLTVKNKVFELHKPVNLNP